MAFVLDSLKELYRIYICFHIVVYNFQILYRLQGLCSYSGNCNQLSQQPSRHVRCEDTILEASKQRVESRYYFSCRPLSSAVSLILPEIKSFDSKKMMLRCDKKVFYGLITRLGCVTGHSKSLLVRFRDFYINDDHLR